MPSLPSAVPLVPFSGKVKSVRFTNAENGYSVFEIEDSKRGALTLLGEVPPLSKGMMVNGTGQEQSHPKYGMQIRVSTLSTADPVEADGIVGYLVEYVNNVGPVIAKRMVKAFGSRTMEIIREHPERVREVPGIGPERAEAISKAARELVEVERVMVFLRTHGIGGATAMKLFRQYKDKTLETLTRDPWVAADHIEGVGFLTADAMAGRLGLGGMHPGRLRAGLDYALKSAERNGHTGLPVDRLHEDVAALLGSPSSDPAVCRRLEELVGSGEIVSSRVRPSPAHAEEVRFLQRPRMARLERGLAQNILQLIEDADLPWRISELEADLAKQCAVMEQPPSRDQEDAIRRMIRSPVSVLTGGPGTGKTRTVGIFLALLRKRYPKLKVALCAPAGKAAERLYESVGGLYEASTTHRLLKAGRNGQFTHNRDNPLEHQLVLADESSMYDTPLLSSLVEAIGMGGSLLLVGDIDQLPSIGPGAVLLDLIESGVVPVSRLTQVHRQAAESKIIVNAHLINQGKVNEVAAGADFSLGRVETSEQLAERCQEVYGRMLAKGIPASDILVMTAGHRGPSGTMAINERLRQAFNGSPTAVLKHGTRTFGLGDRVIVTRNNYDIDVRNGQLGEVVGIREEDRAVVCRIDSREVVFPKNSLEDLSLGYCITVHKAQGSQAPYVMCLFDKAHYTLLERSLAYTAVTRAAQHCIVLSRETSFEMAVRNKRSRERMTALFHLLKAAA